ncbi:nuclear pore complex protein Nup214-like [Dreissena polymorpha]|nr:nuclear pore complex protein Nup214-like [Dreissena polymorpha]
MPRGSMPISNRCGRSYGYSDIPIRFSTLTPNDDDDSGSRSTSVTISESAASSSKTYVDNAYNRSVGQVGIQASSTASGLPAFGSAGLTNRSGASAPLSFTPSNISTPVAQPGPPSTNTSQGTGPATLIIFSSTSAGITGSSASFTSTQPATTSSFGTFAARLNNEGGKAGAGANSFSFMPTAPAGTSVGFGVKTATGDATLDAPRSPTEAPPPRYPSGGASAQSPRYSPTPGQTDLTPGAADLTPGTADLTLTAADLTPGAADLTPGAADLTPGPADLTPGAADLTPGAADLTPGPADQAEIQFSQSIREEINHFEREMGELRARAAGVDMRVGSREEMTQLLAHTQDMQAFSDEIRKTVQDQNQKVQGERMLCLDLFSQVEECRRRWKLNTDPKYLHLLKTCALDPGGAERLKHLQQQYQLLDQILSRLRDVDLILDTQWEEYQNRKTNKMAMPTNDALYRVVKSNHSLITAHKGKLRQLEERLKQLKLYNQTSTWSNTSITTSHDVSEFSNLADTLLSGSPIKSSSSHSSVKEERKMSRTKMERLRDHLMSRNGPTVRSTKPGHRSVLTIPDHQLVTARSTTDRENGAMYGNTPQRGAGEFVKWGERDVDRMAQPNHQKDKSSKSQPGNQPVSNKVGGLKGFSQGIIDKGEKMMEKGQQLIMSRDPASTKPGSM